jgi:hypothetical protein
MPAAWLKPIGIRPREIDIFEDAEAGLLRLEGEQAFNALGRNDDHLAGLQVAHETRADDVERAGFGRQNPGAVEIAQHQRPDAERIAAADHLLGRHRHQREGTLDLPHSIDETRVQIALLAGGDKMQKRLGVGGGGEDRALLLQRALHGHGIGQIAVMGDGEAAIGELGEEGLDVAHAGTTRRGIACMADSAVALQTVDDALLGEGVADQADMAFDMELAAVIGNDAGRFLAAMLERMQAQCDDGRGILPAENAEHPAFVVEMVVGLGGKHVVCVCHLKLR